MALLMNSRLSSDAYYQTRHAPEVKSQLPEIQNMLFNLGSYLATQVQEGEKPAARESLPGDTQRLEGWIDTLDAQTPGLRHLCYPEDVCLRLKLTWLALYADGQSDA